MSTRKDIITLPHPSLRKPSRNIERIDNKVQELAEKMKEATLDWEDSRSHEFGVALAAVQIDELERVVVVRKDFNDKSNREFDVYINPEITRTEGEPITELEGCLSVKDVYGYVARYPKVKVKAKNLEGRTVKFIVKGFAARVFQHEIDHTHGITFADTLGKKGHFFHITDSGDMIELDKKDREKLVKELQL